MPVFARWLESTLRLDSPAYSGPPPDAVVVLAAGYTPGSTLDEDRLVRETFMRVKRGIKAYRATGARWLVLSGGSKDKPERQAELMRDLATRLGMPIERIILEARSKNTWEHPRNLIAMDEFHPDSRLIISSSPYHLSRAVREFKSFFPNAVPIRDYSVPLRHLNGWRDWIPQTGALARSTTMLHEYLGIMWYGLKRMIG